MHRLFLGSWAAIVLATASHAATPPSIGTRALGTTEALHARESAMTPTERALDVRESCLTGARPDDVFARGTDNDNDGCHHARGSTHVVHVFVNHAGGTWDAAEMDEADAKLDTAFQHFLDWAPPNAWMTFRHAGPSYSFYLADVPYDISAVGYFETYMVSDAAENLGFDDLDGDGSRIDEMTRFLQDWDGGSDNVILVFQPADYHFTPATASFGTSWMRVGVDHSSAVWTHEIGHVYGACDEYSLSSCVGCAEECQGEYLTEDVENGNCELGPCTTSVPCLMRNNWVGSEPCSYTQRSWAWTDADDDGLLDTTLRPDFDSLQYESVFDLYENGWFIHTNPDWNWVANQRHAAWSVMGVRSLGSSSWGIRVFEENNHEISRASSFVGDDVRFVVGDFNHNRLGQDHFDLLNLGGSGQYVISHEAGLDMVYADGQERTFSWIDENVVRVWDVPLFAGETVQFTLDVDPGLDLGFALFKSDGGMYYAPKSSAVFDEDDWPAGLSESFTYDVPEDDVYGLVVYSEANNSGDFSIKIGPTIQPLTDDVPFNSALDLRLYSYEPNTLDWGVVAVRPDGNDMRLRLYDDENFETFFDASGAYPNVEFVATDYNHGFSSVDYARVSRQSGTGFHKTEWDSGSGPLPGYSEQPWESGDVADVWEVLLARDRQYLFRQYESVPIDAGIYLTRSEEDNFFIRRSEAAAGSNSGTAFGETFLYTTPSWPINDVYGLVMIANDDQSAINYGISYGARVSLATDETTYFGEEITFADISIEPGSWSVVGSRADGDSESQLWLWSCDTYYFGCSESGDVPRTGVSYMAFNGHDEPVGTWYPRARRVSGVGVQATSHAAAIDQDISFNDPDDLITVQGSFAPVQTIDIWDLKVTTIPEDIRITVVPIDEDLDVGVSVVSAADGDNFQSRNEAIADVNDGGPGEIEQLWFDATDANIYGLVVTAEGTPFGPSSDYHIEIRRLSNPVDVDASSDVPSAVALRSATSRGGASMFDIDLPDAGAVEVHVYDVRGRRVRELVSDAWPAGTHNVAWDGRTDTGHPSSPGVYFVRLSALGVEASTKVVRLD